MVPDLATSLPAVTDGGRTYSFHLRTGIRYSTGAPVRASDIRLGIERVLRAGNLTTFYTGIRGARRCVATPARCDLSAGIVVDDAARTITFHLDRPDPDFTDKLALPTGVAVPRGTGAVVHTVLPATGPYMVARLGPPPQLLLVRNPDFRPVDGRPAGYPDKIAMDLGAQVKRAIPAVKDGRADFIGGDFGLPGDVRSSLDAIATRYAGQLHATLKPATLYAFLDTRRAPFDNVDARRALNYAVDRRAFVALKGGPRYAQATCQILPPDFPGYQRYCPYTANAGAGRPWSAPDLAQARRLIARSHTRGMKVTVIGERYFLDGEARLITRLLQQLGYRARLHFPLAQPELLPLHRRLAPSRTDRALPMGHRLPRGVRVPTATVQLRRLHPRRPKPEQRLAVLRPPRRPTHATSTTPAKQRCRRRDLGAGRPPDRRPGSRTPTPHAQEHRVRLTAGRQLRVQPTVGRPLRPTLGPLSPLNRV